MKVTLTESFRQDMDGYENIGYTISADGAAVGEAGLLVDENSAYLERIDIESEHQGRGYGTEAIRQISSIYPTLFAAPDNSDSQRLFERLGRVTFRRGEVDQGFGVYEL